MYNVIAYFSRNHSFDNAALFLETIFLMYRYLLKLFSFITIAFHYPKHVQNDFQLYLNVNQFTCARYDAERQTFHLHGELRGNWTDVAAVAFRHGAGSTVLFNGLCFSQLLSYFTLTIAISSHCPMRSFLSFFELHAFLFLTFRQVY
jgi:hypothetical protein